MKEELQFDPKFAQFVCQMIPYGQLVNLREFYKQIKDIPQFDQGFIIEPVRNPITEEEIKTFHKHLKENF